jgi:hypothetical protein
LDQGNVGAARDEAASAERALRPADVSAQALRGVLRTLGDTLGVPVLTSASANVTSSLELDPRDGVNHLARIDRERAVAVAQAEATVAARRFIDKAHAKLGDHQDLGFYDIEDGAWDIASEDRDDQVLAEQRKDALEELRQDDDGDEEERAGDDPAVIAVHARYDLAAELGEVLRELQKTDEGDLDEIVTDLRDRLSTDGESRKGAKRALSRTIARYQTAVSLRVVVEAYGRLAKQHVSALPPEEQGAEEDALRAIVFGEDG